MNFLKIDNEINIINKFKIDYNDFVFVKLLLMTQDFEKNFELFKKFLDTTKIALNREYISKLIKHSVLDKNETYLPEPGEMFNPINDLVVSEKFKAFFFKESRLLGRELFAEYPRALNIDGIAYTARNFTKAKFNRAEEFWDYYAKSIDYNEQQHKLIIESLRYAVKYDLIKTGILEYVLSSLWEDHIDAMSKGKKNLSSFDNMSLYECDEDDE